MNAARRIALRASHVARAAAYLDVASHAMHKAYAALDSDAHDYPSQVAAAEIYSSSQTDKTIEVRFINASRLDAADTNRNHYELPAIEVERFFVMLETYWSGR